MMKHRILISNDDGVNAPGLRALAHEMHLNDDIMEFAVVGPVGERSAQSHCITITKHLHIFNISVEGALEAFAIDGTPADSIMMALHSPILSNPKFDLVVSGINRGDNCGLHVIYSGTVGAAREAACKDVPAIAFSLDNYKARSQEQYTYAAQHAVSIIKAVLGILPNSVPRPLLSLKGYVINVNFPGQQFEQYKGLQLTFQGHHCSFPHFEEVSSDPHFAANNKGSTDHHDELHVQDVTLRAFRNSAGYLRTDERLGSDSYAMKNGWVAVTPIGLTSDVAVSVSADASSLSRGGTSTIDTELGSALHVVLKSAAAEMKVQFSEYGVVQ